MNRYPVLALLLLLVGGCYVRKTNENTAIITMDSPAKEDSGEPYLFADEKGKVYLSWLEKMDDHHAFKYSSLTDGKWSEPIMIDSGKNWFVNWADYPMIASSGKDLIAHYLEKNGEGTFSYDVKVTSSPDQGKTWKTPVALHDDGKEAEHGFVSMLPYQENFFFAWLDGRNTVVEGMENHAGHHGAMSLRAAIVDKEGNKISEWELDNRTCDCCQTSAAITESGPVVVYRDRSEDEIRDISIVRLVNNTWTKPEAIYHDNWKIAGCPVNGPRVVANGNFLAIAWYTVSEGKSKVRVIFSHNAGKSFGNPVQVDEGRAIGRVDIVMLERESIMVSWMEGTTIKAVKVRGDGTKDSSLTIASSSEARSSGFPQMTKSGNELFFAWTDDKDKIVKVARLAF
ncbi:MAG TPA: exo-alpha-sialidase [Chryseolinea sp.]